MGSTTTAGTDVQVAPRQPQGWRRLPTQPGLLTSGLPPFVIPSLRRISRSAAGALWAPSCSFKRAEHESERDPLQAQDDEEGGKPMNLQANHVAPGTPSSSTDWH